MAPRTLVATNLLLAALSIGSINAGALQRDNSTPHPQANASSFQWGSRIANTSQLDALLNSALDRWRTAAQKGSPSGGFDYAGLVSSDH
ncbi:hypothetical protein OC844_007543, partial [Tilletia horrida]